MQTEKPSEEIIDCEICLSEIPDSVVQNAEADEYVSHYCGLECYQRMRERREQQ